ncbi:MAG TPA: cytochrome c [Acetobacteraceae bacterium]
MRYSASWLALTAVSLPLGAFAAPVSGQDTGQALFQGACATCHAAGSPRVLAGKPLLPDTRAITGADPGPAIRLILHGRQPPPDQRGPWMPGFATTLSDAHIAALLAWLRQSAGQPPWPYLAQQVHAARIAGDVGAEARQ